MADLRFDRTCEFIRLGWMRWTPRSSTDLFLAVAVLEEEGHSGAPWEQPEESLAMRAINEVGGLEGDPWYEDDLGDLPPDERIEAEQHERGFRARVERAARALGVGPITTNRDCFEFLLNLGVIEAAERDGLMFYRTAFPLPVPGERIPMTQQERAEEDALRWRDLQGRNAQEIIRLFVERDLTTFVSTLGELGHELAMDPEDVRHAILTLVAEGDLSASQGIERLGADHQFELTVDWNSFDEERVCLGIKFPSEGLRS